MYLKHIISLILLIGNYFLHISFEKLLQKTLLLRIRSRVLQQKIIRNGQE